MELTSTKINQVVSSSLSSLNINRSSSNVLSFNRPTFCPNASWNPSATTVAVSSTIGSLPFAFFVNTLNTLFVAHPQNGHILIWRNGSVNTTTTILTNLSSPSSLFVNNDEEIFVDNRSPNKRVDRWTSNGAQLPSPMSTCSQCRGLFVDSNDDLYCSQYSSHQVVRRSLQNPSNPTTIVAGTGCNGSAATLLNQLWGIFVAETFDLYVADDGNNRIQLFRSGEINATTVMINQLNGTIITLNCPTGVMLDGNGFLFIVDNGNHRILGSDRWGFRCVVGCSGGGTSAPNQLFCPQTMNFDRDGNLLVLDTGNSRVQKFYLTTNSCNFSTETTSMSMMTTSEITTIVNSYCSSPSLTLIPSWSNISSPLQFRRDEDIWISSTIELICNKSFSLEFLWTISNGSRSFLVDPNVVTLTSSELFVPFRTLPFGVYQFTLTMTFNGSSNVTRLSQSAYVRINPAGITANLVLLGTSQITRGEEQELELNPGLYSVDLDEDQFNASDWTYEYYCRIYGMSNFPNINGSLIPLDDLSLWDPRNPSCLNNRTVNGSSSVSWRYVGVQQSLKSSLIILGRSFVSNRTYQFMVHLTNRRNPSRQGNTSLLLRVEQTSNPLIIIGCVIPSLCVPNLEYQLINPTTQVSLRSFCLGNCSFKRNITWNIYQGQDNSSSSSNNFTQWTLFNRTNLRFFFGLNSSHFTVDQQFFSSNPSIELWRFEVVYSFPSSTSSSSLNFLINRPPRNGSCSIEPENGTTLTLFTVSCQDWFDSDGIKDYSLFISSNDTSQRSMIAFSSVSTFEVYFPSNSDLQLMILIRDRRDCLTEWRNLSHVVVQIDWNAFDDLLLEATSMIVDM